MSDDTKTESKGQAAVYVAWTTFRNHIIEGLAGGLPNQIDKTIFPGLAGGVQGQLMAGLKFLGLIADNGRPTKALEELTVEDEAQRKKVLATILRARYADLFALGLEKATSKQLNDVMESAYSVTGDTREKAVRFFMGAAEYAEIPLSRHIGKANGRSSSPAAKRRSRKPTVDEVTPPSPADKPSSPTSSPMQRTIELDSGGTVTVSTAIDLFNLSVDDRDFVIGLIDKLREYEARYATEEEDAA